MSNIFDGAVVTFRCLGDRGAIDFLMDLPSLCRSEVPDLLLMRTTLC
jgi:hypothetical protein